MTHSIRFTPLLKLQ
ncbi:CRISPR-associated DxTHG motif protein [Chloroflexota bacterium]